MSMIEKFVYMLTREADRHYSSNDTGIREQTAVVKSEIVAVLDQAHIVVNDAMTGEWMRQEELRRDVSPPFKTCFIQTPEGVALQSRDVNGKVEKLFAVFIHELEPYFYVFAIMKDDFVDPGGSYRLQTGYINTAREDHEQHYIWDVVLTFLQPFAQAHAIGTEKVNIRLKYKRGGEKVLQKIKRVVHVFPKTKRAREEAEQKYQIEWSHRWAVRGHWREIKGVGKDRSGAYGVKGFTWVMEHVKGPEDKPYIEKTRVVDSSFFDTQQTGGESHGV
jgi:hypothetical protein